MTAAGVTTATDITGFGLAGHLGEMAAQSGVEIEVYGAAIPVFPGVLELIRAGVISGAVERNREYAASFVRRDKAAGEDLETLLYDPQTSGGLLIAVRASKTPALLAALRAKGVNAAAVVGRVVRKAAKPRLLLLARAPRG
jgi:selenide,water dikinase